MTDSLICPECGKHVVCDKLHLKDDAQFALQDELARAVAVSKDICENDIMDYVIEHGYKFSEEAERILKKITHGV